MSIITATIANVLNPATTYPYEDFANKPVAFSFKNPSLVDILSINGVDIGNITALPAISVIEDPDLATNCQLNWPLLNSESGWFIPISGTSRYLAYYTYLTDTYYTIFGQIDAEGNRTINGLGSDLYITLETNGEDPVVIVQGKLEAQAVKVPCGTIVQYYNDDGIISIPIT